MKTDPRIDRYIAAAAPFAQPILKHLRQLVHRGCPAATETMKWSSPSFEFGGKILCGMAAFKEHATFGFWHAAMEQVVARDRGSVEGAMGLLGRITSVDDLPDDRTLLGYIRKAAELTASGAPSRPRPAVAKKPLSLPADLAAALRRNKQSSATWENFPPSSRRDYIEWVTEAKRPETRAQRIATTVAWTAEGKRRNWKYENC